MLFQINEKIRIDNLKTFSFPIHLHNEIEIMICTDGKLKVNCNRQEKTLKKGDIMIAFPNEMHSYTQTNSGEGIMIIFPSDLSPFITSVLDSGSFNNFPHNPKAIILATELYDCSQKNVNSITIYGYIHTLFGMITEKILEKKNMCDINTFNKAIIYTSLNYTAPLNLKKLSKVTGVSTAHLSRLFSEKIEGGFKNYLQLLRVEKAKNLLTTTNMKMYEVQFNSGFSDQTTFNRVFKNLTNMTPKQYRKKSQILIKN